jgi:hyperosmotically inducible periplasmic protein
MARKLSAALLAVVAIAPASQAAQGPLQRAGQALDNAGKNIRRGVENGVARGQITAQERELLSRVSQRIQWDKQLVSSTLQLVVQADGTVNVRGSVIDEAAKARAVDLVENTVGVTRVVDELAVVKDVKVIQAKPARVIESVPTRVIEPPKRVITIPPSADPIETEVIVKP